MESSDKVVAMITSLDKAQTGPLVIQGETNRVGKIPIEISAPKPVMLMVKPQYPVVSLKAVPWNYGNGMEETSEYITVLPKNNPLILPRRLTKSWKKLTEKVSEEKLMEFLEKMGHNEAMVVRKLEEASV